MEQYIFHSSKAFEDNCLALPPAYRPNLEQIRHWNKLAAMNIRKEYASAPPKEYYAWIGIVPPPGTYTMRELWDLAIKQMPYDNFIICVEQNTDAGLRPHLHAVAKITHNTRPKKEIARFQKIFSVENNSVHYKIFGKALLEARVKYVKGEKTEEKKEKNLQDISDRRDSKIPNFLSVGIL